MIILTLNAGSSSIKYKVFCDHKPLLSGLIEGIGENPGSWTHQHHIKIKNPFSCASHEEAFLALSKQLHTDLGEAIIDGVGHRVVHGGEYFNKATVITSEVLQKIEDLAALAPLHNPVNAVGIRSAQALLPEACHVAVFDTSFHRTLPEYSRFYPVNKLFAEQHHIQRYGFHGINHQYVSTRAAAFLQRPLEECNFISVHLGNGASCCLIKNGQSVDTSMGFTPLAGLMMGTRCGDVDPAIILYLIRQGYSADEVEALLNKQSGLKGIAGHNDMRVVLTELDNGNPEAALAVEMYIYCLHKVLGAYLVQVERVDSIIFTGGIGENSAYIRERCLMPLRHLNISFDKNKNNQSHRETCYSIATDDYSLLVIQSDEESLIAEETAKCVI